MAVIFCGSPGQNSQERTMPIPLNAKYVHTNLTGRDWRVLVRFYCEVFGCIPKPPQRDLSGAWLDALTSLSAAHLTGMHVTLPGYGPDGPTLEIFSYDAMLGAEKPVVNEPGFGHIAFLVDDVAAALRAVRQAGGGSVGQTTKSQVPGVGLLTVVYATDPDGNIIELQNWS
jgi:predicted enzyme related to lactoylglutathione lyase